MLGSDSQAGFSLTTYDGKTTYVLTQSPTSSGTATSLAFLISDTIVSGLYQVKVRNDYGESNPVNLTVNWNVGTVSWASGGSVAGNIVNLTAGSGYPSSIDGTAFSITITAASKIYPVNIVSCCSNNTVVFALPPFAAVTSLSIAFVGPAGKTSKSYSVSASYTPSAHITSSLNVNPGTNTITVAADNNVTANITAVSLVSAVNSTNIVSATFTTTGSGTTAVTTVTATLASGLYKLLVLTVPYGYLNITDIINVSISSDAQVTTQPISFNGGTVEIIGTNLSPSSFIIVNGFRGNILSYKTSSVIYNVAAFVTKATQDKFKLQQVALLNLSQFTFFSDQNSSVSNVSAAFDNLINTIYGSPNTQCWIGVDAGPSLQISVSRIRFIGNLNWNNLIKYTLYAVFQGSNDQTQWNDLGKIDQTAHIGWNTIISGDTTPYRYIRFSHNSTSNCQLAEIQLYGIVSSTIAVPSTISVPSDILYVDGANNKSFGGALEFR